MQRKKLLSLSSSELPFDPKGKDVIIENPFQHSHSCCYWYGYRKELKHAYTTEIVQIKDEDILILNIFDLAGKQLHRWFYDKSGHFFMWDYEKERESKATFKYTAEYHLHGLFATTKQYSDLLIDFLYDLKTTAFNDALEMLCFIHTESQAEKTQIRHNRIKERIDKRMAEVTELPKGIYKWIDNHLLLYSRYIFYTYSRKKFKDGYCSHCKTEVKIQGTKHKASGVCPNCKSKVTFIAKGRFSTAYDEESFIYLQPTKNGFIKRNFTASRYYKEDYSFDDSLHEYEREFFINDGLGFFEAERPKYIWDDFMNTGERRFCESYDNSHDYTYIYPSNLNQLLKPCSPEAKYVDYNQIAKKCGKLFDYNLRKFIEYPRAYKCIEQMMKLGLYNLAHDAIADNVNFTNQNDNITKVLDITKAELKEIRKLNPTNHQLYIYINLKRKAGISDQESITWVDDTFSQNELSILYKLLERLSFHKIYKYLNEQKENYEIECWYTNPERERLQKAIRDWRDYLRDAETLEMNIKNKSVLFPKNLPKQHQRLIEMVEAIKDEKINKWVAKRENPLNKLYKYQNGRYIIRAPKSQDEIIKEGEILKHCVGNYAEDHARGKTIILLIRKIEEPEVPYCTLELDPNTLNIIQYHGYANDRNKDRQLEPEVKVFIKTWEKNVVKKLKQTKTVVKSA